MEDRFNGGTRFGLKVSAGASWAFLRRAPAKLVQESPFVTVEQLRKLSIACILYREALGKKSQVPLAVLELQPELVSFGSERLRFGFGHREFALQFIDTAFKSFDPASSP